MSAGHAQGHIDCGFPGRAVSVFVVGQRLFTFSTASAHAPVMFLVKKVWRLAMRAKKINVMQDAKEMEFNYMTAACQILLGPGRAGHPIVVQEGFKI